MKTKLLILFLLFAIASCKKDDTYFNPSITYGSLTDSRDNNVYKTVTIGQQIWMAENLKYNPNSEEECISCEYGILYTSHETTLCPANWHTPSLSEWNQLIEFLGGKEVAGGKLKEAGESHWEKPNSKASNSSGFTALPAGVSSFWTGLVGRKKLACFWTSTPILGGDYTLYNYNISLSYNSESVKVNDEKPDYEEEDYFSIRCVKN